MPPESSLTVEVVPSGRPRWRVWIATRGISGREPMLAVRNDRGHLFTLFPAANAEDAAAKRDRLERELAELGVEAFCDRYVVPGDFVSGSQR